MLLLQLVVFALVVRILFFIDQCFCHDAIIPFFESLVEPSA